MNPNGGCNNDEQYGVDINRNFDFMWSDPDGASSNPCDSDYHGSSAESEPETEALAQYARDLFPQGQRKDDPEGDMNVPFGEDITGIYADIHSSGGYVVRRMLMISCMDQSLMSTTVFSLIHHIFVFVL